MCKPLEVREASYDMEDVLDTFLERVDAADPSRLERAMKKMGKVFGKAKARRNIAGAIEDIKKHLEEVAERRQKYKLDDIMCKPHSQQRQLLILALKLCNLLASTSQGMSSYPC